MGGAGLMGGFNGGFGGDAGFGRDGSLGLGGATKNRSRGPPGHPTLWWLRVSPPLVASQASRLWLPLASLPAGGTAWGRWGDQLEHRGGLGQGAEGGLGLAVPKERAEGLQRICFGCCHQLLRRRWLLLVLVNPNLT